MRRGFLLAWTLFLLGMLCGTCAKTAHAETPYLIGITGDDYLWMTTFQADAERVALRLIAHEPMLANQTRVQFVIVPTQRDLYCGRTSTISRLATCNTAIARDVFTQAGYAPHQIVILWNNGTYSGSGGKTCVSYNGSQMLDVAEHECVGHGIGGLKDSYLLYNINGTNADAFFGQCWKGVAPPPGWPGAIKECNYKNYWREGNDCMRALPCRSFLPYSRQLIQRGIDAVCGPLPSPVPAPVPTPVLAPTPMPTPIPEPATGPGAPSIVMKSPMAGQVVTGKTVLTVQAYPGADRPQSLAVFLDGQQKKLITFGGVQSKYLLTGYLYFDQLPAGSYVVKAVVTDALGRTSEVEATVTRP